MFWFDLDNSPHVPLFRPIITSLGERGVASIVTAREHAQTIELLKLWKIPHTVIGVHAGKSKLKKVINLLQRARRLKTFVREQKPGLAVSHGSRTQLLAAWQLGIPSVLMMDYEYTESRIFNNFARWLLIPSFIPDARLKEAGLRMRKVIRYEGFKEEVYLKDFVPVQGFRRSLGIDDGKILVTIRPPSVTGNYHDPLSEELFAACISHCSSRPDAHVLIVNRTAAEHSLLRDVLRGRANVSTLQSAVDGLQLLWSSDVVISGGGTMNRESALLGVPTFSIFTGRKPYLDELLQEKGRLRFIGSVQDVNSIPVIKRSSPGLFSPTNIGIVENLVQQLVDLEQTSRG